MLWINGIEFTLLYLNTANPVMQFLNCFVAASLSKMVPVPGQMLNETILLKKLFIVLQVYATSFVSQITYCPYKNPSWLFFKGYTRRLKS